MEILSESHIRDAIVSFLSDSMGITVESGSTFAKMGVDSMAILKILLFLERELGIYIPDSELTWENIKTVETLSATAYRIISKSQIA